MCFGTVWEITTTVAIQTDAERDRGVSLSSAGSSGSIATSELKTQRISIKIEQTAFMPVFVANYSTFFTKIVLIVCCVRGTSSHFQATLPSQ